MSRRTPYEIKEPKKGPVLWRSLEDKYAEPAELKREAEAEQPGGFLKGSASLLKKTGSKKKDPLAEQPRVSRRGFLATGGAGVAALSLQGCVRRPVENILPYVRGPEYSIPGVATHFATVTQRGGDSLGLLVTSHEGRPTKVEGNADHPSSRGATDLHAQAMIWDLYDPDRSKGPAMREGEELVDKTVAEFDAALNDIIRQHYRDQGRGLRILSQPTNSPTFARLRTLIKERLPQAKFHSYAPITDDNIRAGLQLAFGQALMPSFDLSQASVVLALDSDCLGSDSGSVRHCMGFGPRRAIRNPDSESMSRLYSVEAAYSVTGAAADHRLRLPAQDIEGFLKALAKDLVERHQLDLGSAQGAIAGATAPAGSEELVHAIAADLAGARRRAPIIVGPRQPARVHALAFVLNHALGNIGATVQLYSPLDGDEPTSLASLAELMGDLERAQTLLILGGNPVYDAPADMDFAAALGRDGLTSIHLSSHRDETSQACTWHYPIAHELETWGDQRAVDGTLAVQQPLIAPIWGGRSPIEILGRLARVRNWRGYYLVRQTMRRRAAAGGVVNFEREWRRTLHRGIVGRSATAPVMPVPALDSLFEALRQAPAAAELSKDNLEVQFLPDPALFDGRFANNIWCQECPDPMTKIVWDNAALMSKTTRDELGLRNGDMIRLTKGEASIELPVWTLPGHANNSISLLLGWGRTAAGRYGNAQTWNGLAVEPDWRAGGFDVGALRSSDAFHFTSGVQVTRTGDTYELVQTQTHGRMEGRAIAIQATLEEYRDEPEFASYRTVEFVSTPPLWEEVDYSSREVATDRPLHKWGMVIDLSSCTGCNTCVIACQAENNIPNVGKQEVRRGREMHWMRIDRYFVGETDDEPGVTVQPVMCQQCEEAPCENVCPVNATAHSPEGLNDMAYNRCIGTRYCANNCPYKVRRFNYLDWHNHLDTPWQFHGAFSEVSKMRFNPNVTVRMRGVMEKCTYCVQRIQEAKFRSRREHRPLRDGDIVTACEAACPSRAIVFGDLNDESSRVSQQAAVNRGYKLLAEVGAQPRTTYLGRITNPNPALASNAEEGDEAPAEEEG